MGSQEPQRTRQLEWFRGCECIEAIRPLAANIQKFQALVPPLEVTPLSFITFLRILLNPILLLRTDGNILMTIFCLQIFWNRLRVTLNLVHFYVWGLLSSHKENTLVGLIAAFIEAHNLLVTNKHSNTLEPLVSRALVVPAPLTYWMTASAWNFYDRNLFLDETYDKVLYWRQTSTPRDVDNLLAVSPKIAQWFSWPSPVFFHVDLFLRRS